jgi:hypothetical protein
MTRFSRVVLASCLVGSALGFEQLAGFKMPSLQGLQKAAQNKAKFGDKKLAIVTGTSSGACRHNRACTGSRTAARVRDILCLRPRDSGVQIPAVCINLTHVCMQVSDARRSSTSCAPANITSLAPCAILKRSAPSPSPSVSALGFQAVGPELSAVSGRVCSCSLTLRVCAELADGSSRGDG